MYQSFGSQIVIDQSWCAADAPAAEKRKDEFRRVIQVGCDEGAGGDAEFEESLGVATGLSVRLAPSVVAIAAPQALLVCGEAVDLSFKVVPKRVAVCAGYGRERAISGGGVRAMCGQSAGTGKVRCIVWWRCNTIPLAAEKLAAAPK